MSIYSLIITIVIYPDVSCSSEMVVFECRSYHEVTLSEKKTYRESLSPTSKDEQILRALSGPVDKVKDILKSVLSVCKPHIDSNSLNYMFIPKIIQEDTSLSAETKKFISDTDMVKFFKAGAGIIRFTDEPSEVIATAIDSAKIRVEEVRLGIFQGVTNKTGHWE